MRTALIAALALTTGCSALAPYEVSDIGERGGYCSNARLLGIADQDAYLSALMDGGYINSTDAAIFRESMADGSRTISTGMSECGVRMVWGAPDDVDYYGSEYGQQMTFTYISDAGYYKYDYDFVRFRNGVVTSWSID